MEILEGNRIACSRCEEVIPLEEAVGLDKKTGTVFKPLCADCLSMVGCPQGFELERDITYFARD